MLDHQNDDQFYDFDSKYMDASASHVEVPANLPSVCLRMYATWLAVRSRP